MKSLLKITLILISILHSEFVIGQNSLEDVVYLKNGSIIRGVIVEQVPNQSLKIQTADRSLFVFRFDEIEKISKDYPTNSKNESLNNEENGKTSRWINWTEYNYCPGVDLFKLETKTISNIGNFSVGFNSVHGLKLNENIALGLGVGFDKNNFAMLIPVSIDGRIALYQGKISPIISAKLGYSISIIENDGGLILNPKIGFRISLNQNLSYILNIGYKWQNIEYFDYRPTYYYPYYNINDYSSYNVKLKFVTISTGFEF
jgi:hypothetical protein